MPTEMVTGAAGFAFAWLLLWALKQEAVAGLRLPDAWSGRTRLAVSLAIGLIFAIISYPAKQVVADAVINTVDGVGTAERLNEVNHRQAERWLTPL